MAMSIGGFFATLTLKVDKGFDDAGKSFDVLENKIKGTGLSFGTFVGDAIKGLTAMGAAAVGVAYAVSQIQGKNSVVATGAGMKLDEYNKWAVAMGIIGQNADDLASHLAVVNDAMTELGAGGAEKFTAMANKLAYFTDKNNVGINVNDFKKASQTERMNMIADRIAGASGDKRTALINRAGEIFGDSFKNMMFTFDTPNSPYKNIHELEKQSEASATKNDPNSLANMLAFNRVMVDLQQNFKTVGDKFSDFLRGPLNLFANFLETHKKDIEGFVDGFIGGIKKVVDFFQTAGEVIGIIFETLDKWVGSKSIFAPVWEGVGKYVSFLAENVRNGADIESHWNTMKGLDSPEKVAMFNRAMDLSHTDVAHSIGYDVVSSGAYKTVSQFQDITGGGIPQGLFDALYKIERDKGLSGDMALSFEAAVERAMLKAKVGTPMTFLIDAKTESITQVSGPMAGSVTVTAVSPMK